MSRSHKKVSADKEVNGNDNFKPLSELIDAERKRSQIASILNLIFRFIRESRGISKEGKN